MRRIWIAIAVLALLVPVVAARLRFFLPLPQVTGEMAVDGLSSPVEILRDRYGIPHIRARNRSDAIFALGFVHAQDRLWQMEVQRRAAAGRLAEALGPDALPIDRFMRTVGFARAAREARKSLDAVSLDAIDAYVRGVNDFLSRTSGWRLPVEYSLTGTRPEPWTADDVVASMKLLAWGQGMNWREDLLHLQLTAKLGAARAAELVPGESILSGGVPCTPPSSLTRGAPTPRSVRCAPLAPVAPSDAEALGAVARVLDRIAPPSSGASNAWVIAGRRTATGRPILANDPHVPAQAPGTWYLVHLTGGTLDVIGATFPGACAVIVGHNGRVAWGATNAMADAQDLFVVRDDEPTTAIEEVIKVKGEDDVRMSVRVSANGPVISDLVGERGRLALRWTGLDREDSTLAAFLGLADASSAQDVRAALARMHAPVIGFVYADAGGEIAYAAAGSIPIRGVEDRVWSAQSRAEAVASIANPPSGFIVAANNAVGGSASSMSTSFDLPYRAARIAQMIESTRALSIEDVRRMQLDVVSLQPKALAPLLFDRAEALDARSVRALAMLKAWDGGMRADSAEAAIYKRYYREAARALLRDDLGDALWADYHAYGATLARAMHRFAKQGAGTWCDDIEQPGEQSCGSTLGAALTRALDSLEDEQGANMSAWRWDEGNVVRFAHMPMDNVSWLRPLFSRTLQRPGDGFTVNAVMRIREQTLIPSYRQIIDVGDWDRSRFVAPLGQSGHPISAHYDDLLSLWNQGRDVPMAFTEAAVRAAARWSLILRPRHPGSSSSAETPR